MAKVTLILCDIKPCRLPAEREFEINGETIYVCGESCFLKYWSREYHGWKATRYTMQTTFQYSSALESEQQQEDQICTDLFKSLHLAKPV